MRDKNCRYKVPFHHSFRKASDASENGMVEILSQFMTGTPEEMFLCLAYKCASASMPKIAFTHVFHEEASGHIRIPEAFRSFHGSFSFGRVRKARILIVKYHQAQAALLRE